MKRLKYFLIGLAILIIVAGFYSAYLHKKATSYKKILSEKEALLILDYGKGKKRWFKGEVIEGMTVLDALKVSSLAGNFDFKANSKVESIDGLSNNNHDQWQCYLNNKLVKNLNQELISPQDKISCRYR